MRNTCWIGFLCCMVCGCATQFPASWKKAKDAFARGDFDQAEKIISTSREISKDDKNRVLADLDRATVALEKGRYGIALAYLMEAQDLSKKLYTQSITNNLAAATALGDTHKPYRGPAFERSVAYYYMVLAHTLLSEVQSLEKKTKIAGSSPPEPDPPAGAQQASLPSAKGSPTSYPIGNAQTELSYARAEVLNWDSGLEQMRRDSSHLFAFPDDLLAKIVGGFIHRKMDTVNDHQIARILCENARKTFERWYPLLPTFNEKASLLSPRAYELALREGIKPDIELLTTPAWESAQSVLSACTNKKSNLLYLLESGVLRSKKQKTITLGLSTLFDQIEDPQLRANVELLGFEFILETAPKLGLALAVAAAAGAATSSGDEAPHSLTQASDKILGFEIRVPDLDCTTPRRQSLPQKLVFESINTPQLPAATQAALETDVSNTGTGLAKSITLPLGTFGPLHDLSCAEWNAVKSATFSRTLTRVGLKYFAALVSAILVYKNSSHEEWLAILLASATWIAAKRVIDATEIPDLRSWDFLPQNIQVALGTLPPGTYHVSVHYGDARPNLPLGDITIPEKGRLLWRRRLFLPVATQDSVSPTKSVGLR